MANEPTINLALVGEMPENPVRGTIYMSPDTSGNFVKVGVDGAVRTIFDGSNYVLKEESPWVSGEGEGTAVLKQGGSKAIGAGAVAHGYDTSALGDYSHAEGYSATASDRYSHAEGQSTTASGQYSHAEGCGTYIDSSIFISGDANATTYTTNIAHGLKAGDIIKYKGIIAKVTAINTNKKFTVDHTLSDVQLTSVGFSKIKGISYGSHSHAEGYATRASGQNSHAEGYDTIAYGSNSHAEGYATTASGSGSHAEGYATIATRDYSHAEGYTTRAYEDYSHAEGYITTASGQYSHAEGQSTTASGKDSHAEGYITTASGQYSHAEGQSTTASSYGSHAEGYITTASGKYSHAEGQSTTAFGDDSHAEGYITTASGKYSHAEGQSTTAFGDDSHAEGYSVTASGKYSHAEGNSTIAFGDDSHAEGRGSSESLSFTISGAANATTYTTNVEHDLKVGDVLKYNTTIVKVSGFDTRTQFTVDKTLSITKLTNTSSVKRIRGISYSEYSHAEGENTTTFGYSSHAEGTVTTTSGDYSHAEGRYTYTSNAYEHAQGSYNMSHNYNTTFGDNGNTLNSIGVGVSDASRSNVIEVMQNGDVYVKGVGSYDGSNYVDASTLQEVVNSGGGSADSMTSITYANLKNLRDTSALIPGMQYRITDYHTTVSPIITNARSADHQFDIIVRADDASHLNENGYAAHHEGDEYFAACKLEAWTLQYRLENEKWSKVAGTFIEEDGDSYHLRKLGTVEVDGTTYVLWDASELTEDYEIVQAVSEDEEVGTELKGYDPETGEILDEGWTSSIASKVEVEADGQGTILMLKDEYGNQCPYDFKSIQFKRWAVTDSMQGRDGLDGKYMGVLNHVPQNLSIEDETDFIWAYTFSSDATGSEDQVDYSLDGTHWVYGNVLAMAPNAMNDLNDIVFYGEYNYGNRFGFNCYVNTFGNGCNNNTFGNYCQYNSFGNNCQVNSFGNGCFQNSFGNGCNNNTFGNYCQYNSFGNGCNNNTFGNYCQYNSFGNNCQVNSFGNGCFQNSFGNGCNNNTFGNYCQYNSFGNGCNNNTFGNYCQYNSFGNNCQVNSFGNGCFQNSFGNGCNNNTFGNYCQYNSFGNYCQTITAFDGVQNCSVTGGSQSAPVKNAQILNGTAGASTQNKLTITFAANKAYTQVAAKTTAGALKIYNPADLVQ